MTMAMIKRYSNAYYERLWSLRPLLHVCPELYSVIANRLSALAEKFEHHIITPRDLSSCSCLCIGPLMS